MEATLPQLLAGIDFWLALAIALKTLTYGAGFTAGGGVLFLALFVSQLDLRERHDIGWVLAGAALAGMVCSVLRVMVMSAMMTDDWSGLFSVPMMRMVLASSEGVALGLRLAGLGLIALHFGTRAPRFPLIPLFGALLAIASFGLTGHAGELAHAIGFAPRGVIGLHLLAVAFWLGALWPLYRQTYHHDIGRIAIVMHRFGQLAVVAVGILMVAGALLLWQLLGTPSALWQSAYGQAMMAKLSCVALLLALAAVNKLRLTPRLLDGDIGATPALRRSVAGEMVIASLILLVTATLTSIAGPPALN